MEYTKTQLKSIFEANHVHPGFLGELAKRGYCCAEPKSADILFVGMNPSYTSGSKPESFTFNPQQAVSDYPRFYKPFQDLAVESQNGTNWTYMDTFFFRETTQNKLWPLLATP